MKKRMLGLLPLLLLLLFAACAQAAPPAPAAETPQSSETVPFPTPRTALPAEEQKRVLEENRSLWAFDEGDYAPDWFYTFTDLDHNGLLEVLSASTQGSGMFTYVRYYEVLPDGSGVKNLYHADVEIEGPDDWPEIVLETIPCYYDPAADRYYYVCANLTRDGAAHSVTQVMDTQRTEDSEQIRYFDGAGNTITEQDYQSAVERRFAGMERSELKPDWIAGAEHKAETVRLDGERFETVIQLEGMEETVRYEHIRADTIGIEMDYDYEMLKRQSEPDRECFISVCDAPDAPENYLEVTCRAEDADTVEAQVKAALSQEYELLEGSWELARAGSCIRIEASEVKGTGRMAERLQAVYIIPASDGCRVAAAHFTAESAEGFGRRLSYMLNTLAVIDRRGQIRLTDEEALSAVRRYCFVRNPDLKGVVDAGEYPVDWVIPSSTEAEIVVLFRSYTGAEIRYYIDRFSGETYVTEFVSGITEQEERSDETFNARDYLLTGEEGGAG